MPSIDLSSLGSSASSECSSVSSSEDSLLSLLDDESSHNGLGKRQRTAMSTKNYCWGTTSPATEALEASLLLLSSSRLASPPDELFSFEFDLELPPDLGAQVADVTSGLARMSARASADSGAVASRSM
jgi:hypothetical protein